ncbi:coiled-coil domain-containing protein 90B, mitochondrial-like [Oscarella lobularis]|uniref:coiled-coil domain-containing protein 90B, mitochondrial-like n=1 Tax=Oscarella lobularis TaxID=121494 RepID=UPI003313B30B
MSSSYQMIARRFVGPVIVSRAGRFAMKCRSFGSYHFDTHNVVTRLQNAGFNQNQAEHLCAILHDTVASTKNSVSEESVTKAAVNLFTVEVNSKLNALEKDLRVLESKGLVPLREDTEKLNADVVQLKSFLKDELAKMKSGLTLDLNLEKSRHKDELSKIDERLLENVHKMDIDIASLKTTIETNKLDLIKYLAGSVLSVATLLLGYWRFMKM